METNLNTCDIKECAREKTCPIYTGVLRYLQPYVEAYKQTYCDAGPDGYEKCKRLEIVKVHGFCPENVLPDDDRTVEEIMSDPESFGKF